MLHENLIRHPDLLISHAFVNCLLLARQGTVVMDQIAQLEALLPHATTPARVIDALIHLISAQFDTGASPSTPCMPTAMWRSCQQNIVRVVATFNDNYPAIQLRESDETDAPETTPPVCPLHPFPYTLVLFFVLLNPLFPTPHWGCARKMLRAVYGFLPNPPSKITRQCYGWRIGYGVLMLRGNGEGEGR